MSTVVANDPTPFSGPAQLPGPLAENERIVPIDALRGFALLGILILNIQAFSMPGAAYLNPKAYGNLDGANYWVWYFSQLLAELKFMTIFSMLFGAGIVIMTSRVEASGRRSALLHYRRMGWLLLFGLLHGYLLWYGDILFSYALCGMIVYWLRKLRPRTLLVIGILTVGVGSAISLFFGLTMRFWSAEAIAAFQNENWQPTAELIAEEIAAERGTWMEQLVHRAPTTFFLQTFLFVIMVAWRAGGMMLIGMGLYKLGVFSARRHTGFYLGLVAIAAIIGLPVIAYGLHQNEIRGWSVEYSFFFGGEFNYWGSILVSLGWTGLVMLACRNPRLSPITRPLAAVGQMALTNYLMHTFICTTIFNGHGFGLFGSVERIGQIGIVVAIWIVQLIISPLWLRHFQFGPFEWLWRSLTYFKVQPMRRRSSIAPVA